MKRELKKETKGDSHHRGTLENATVIKGTNSSHTEHMYSCKVKSLFFLFGFFPKTQRQAPLSTDLHMTTADTLKVAVYDNA